MIRNTFITDKNGHEYYSGRYGVALGIVIAIEENCSYILASKRGVGANGHNGEWNLPVGFIEFGESGEEAASREVFEETTILIPSSKFCFHSVYCPANSNTIALRYITYLKHKKSIQYKVMNNTGGEPEEVSDIKWIKIEDIDNYKWCYGHDKVIKHLYDQY